MRGANNARDSGNIQPATPRHLPEAAISQNPLWNREFIDKLAKEHITGRKNYICEINAVVTIEAIERLLFRGLS